MKQTIKVLLIGESMITQTKVIKGFDVLFATSYEEGKEFLQNALEGDDFEFYHMPCHLVSTDFPTTLEGLNFYDVILISDVGANTFLLPPETFFKCKPTPNKLQLLYDWVEEGGGLGMIGGYLSFMGIEGKGKYYGSAIERALPINFLPHDDRKEHPEGISAISTAPDHPVLKGLPNEFGKFFGYNQAIAKKDATVIASVNEDPFIALWDYGRGRTIAYASDCAPHWSPAEFSSSENYKTLWQQIVKWLSRKI